MTVELKNIPEAETNKPIPTEPERIALIEAIRNLPKEQIKDILEIFSMMVRAFEGKEVSPENSITKLIDIKNILERSNFPSNAEINFQVYCRLLAKYHPELAAFETWADIRAQALKSLKALSSEQYVDMFKAQQGGAPQSQTAISFNQPMQQQKKGLFRRQERQPRFNENDPKQ